jgi:hypothetical protein
MGQIRITVIPPDRYRIIAQYMLLYRFGEQFPAKSTLMILRYPFDNLEDLGLVVVTSEILP